MPERNPSLYPYEQPAIPGGTLPWVTFLLVISTFIVFALQVEAGAGDDAIVQMFGFSPGNWNGTRPWSILTYAWIHSLNIFERPDLFWFHVVFNMIPLLCLGPALEDRIGHFSFLLLYLVCHDARRGSPE
jgi:membrane associated rhomboid family serine protease